MAVILVAIGVYSEAEAAVSTQEHTLAVFTGTGAVEQLCIDAHTHSQSLLEHSQL